MIMSAKARYARGGRVSPPPSDVAGMHEQYVVEKRRSDLLAIIKELVDYFGDSERGKFWVAVHKELE